MITVVKEFVPTLERKNWTTASLIYSLHVSKVVISASVVSELKRAVHCVQDAATIHQIIAA